jgi:hypothetical protein
LACRTSQRTDQSLPKSMPAPTQEKYEVFTNTFDNKNEVSKIQNIFSCPSKKIKTPDTQTNPTKTRKLNNDNGLQGRWTERQPITAVWRNGGCSASYDSVVVNQNLVHQFKFSGENRHLRKAAKR